MFALIKLKLVPPTTVSSLPTQTASVGTDVHPITCYVNVCFCNTLTQLLTVLVTTKGLDRLKIVDWNNSLVKIQINEQKMSAAIAAADYLAPLIL